jgi:hypothetical protein
MMRTVIEKDGTEVATATKIYTLSVGVDRLDLPGVKMLTLVYFPTVHLTPPATFEHLAGTGLSRFFDRCRIRSTVDESVPTGSPTEEFRYVHGRSEVMKGRHSVSAVLLARPEMEGEIPEPQWLSYLPEIWKHFLAVYDSGPDSP